MKGSAARGGEMKGRRGSSGSRLIPHKRHVVWAIICQETVEGRARRLLQRNRILHHGVILCSPRGTRRAATAVTARNSRVVQVGPVALSEGSERDLVRASDYPGARRVLRFDCAGRSGRERSLGGGRAQAAPGLPCEAAEPRWLVLGDTKPPESDSTAKHAHRGGPEQSPHPSDDL